MEHNIPTLITIIFYWLNVGKHSIYMEHLGGYQVLGHVSDEYVLERTVR